MAVASALWVPGLPALPSWQPWGVLGWGQRLTEARHRSQRGWTQVRHCCSWCVALEPLVNLFDLPLSVQCVCVCVVYMVSEWEEDDNIAHLNWAIVTINGIILVNT